MGEAEKQDCMQISEELQLVTACLIGHSIVVQTKSFLLSGTLIAASFDKGYGVVLNVPGKEVHHGKIKIFLKDIAYISAENVSLHLDKEAIFESCTKANCSKVVMCISHSSVGQSSENVQTAEQDAASFASSTNTVLGQKALHHLSQENTVATVPSSMIMASTTITGVNEMYGENTQTAEQHAESFTGSTNTVCDQKLHHPSQENTDATVLSAMSMANATITGVNEMASYMYPLNSFSQPMIPIMQPAQIDNSFQGVQINSQPKVIPALYPKNYDVQWQYANAGGQYVTYVPPHYTQAAQHVQDYVAPLEPQVQGYIHQPQYRMGSQNFVSSNPAPRGQ